jgi:hypothetical protein
MMKKGITYPIRKAVIAPSCKLGNMGLNAFKRGMTDEAIKDIMIIIIIKVMIIIERKTDQRKCLPLLTLKITFNAFSMAEKN